jgi:hypothetical protein
VKFRSCSNNQGSEEVASSIGSSSNNNHPQPCSISTLFLHHCLWFFHFLSLTSLLYSQYRCEYERIDRIGSKVR